MRSKSIHTIAAYIAILVVCLSLIPLKGFPETRNVVGKIVAIRGQATAVRQGDPLRALSHNSPIFQNDIILTQNGRLQIMFTDNTLITLGRHTKMAVEQYLWQPGDPASSLRTRIQAGSFRVMGGAITRDAPMNFTTEAPSATIGIRGSMYAGIVSGSTLSVVYQGGKGIYVSNPKGRVEIDRPGFGTVVTGKEAPPAPPVKFTKAVLEQIEGGLADAGESPQGNEAADPAETLSESEISQSDASAALQTPLTVTDAVAETVVDNASEILKEETMTGTVTEPERALLDLLGKIGFAGSRSTRVPDSGIWTYKGISMDTDLGEGSQASIVHVNWDTRRLMAFDHDPDNSKKVDYGFALGEITGTGKIQNVRIFGSGGEGETPYIYAFTGSETFGHFFGSSQEAAGMIIGGTDYPLHHPVPLVPLEWSDTVAVLFDKKDVSTDFADEWNGFFIGLGENMDKIDTGRVSFINDDAADFSIRFDRDTGTFSGTMTGHDALGSEVRLSDLSIGGSKTQSVYISEDMLGAELQGESGIRNGYGTAALKPYGNYMVSSKETPLSENTHWGYWEIAYNEPGTGDDYHVHVPGSLWLAGNRTPAAAVQSLIDRQAAGTLTYSGRALGMKIDSQAPPGMPQVLPFINGTTRLDVDFPAKTISGSIDFSEVSLPVSVTSQNFLVTGFKGTIPGASSSEVNGAFFGDNAQGIGGNFSAKMGGTTFQGIFAGDR